MKHFFILLLSFLAILCQGQDLDKDARIGLKFLMIDNPTFSKGFTGFQLYNPKTEKLLYDSNGDKYFTPASNTKIFTLLSALEILPDSLPTIHYTIRGDKLIFSGTGDPTFLNDLFDSTSSRAFQFLQESDLELYYAPKPLEDETYGPGWAWDDYAYYFQCEKATFPIYGNLAKASFENGAYKMTPNFTNIRIDNEQPYPVIREEEENIFTINPSLSLNRSFEYYIPFEYSDSLFLKLLKDTLQKPIQLYLNKIDLDKSIASHHADSVYKVLMHESDNFIAEQLLLMCANELKDTFDVSISIKEIRDQHFDNDDLSFQWVDGSGLSRYNLMSPRDLIDALGKIYKNVSWERIKTIFALGANLPALSVANTNQAPFVFAKTGSLKNKFCVSGFVETKRNGILIFSFMHNNYIGSSEPVALELNRILNYIRNKY
ncbi:MAG: D-alanyl-D-alanine carboxypeptidase [Bacteroidota bacterium]